jgi:hypothetical protein
MSIATLFLLRPEGGEEPARDAREIAGAVALRQGLDLDHIRAEIGQNHPAARPHDHLRELGDAQSFERQGFHAASP